MNWKSAAALSVALSVLATIVSGWYHDWVCTALGVYSAVFSYTCFIKSNDRYSVFCLASSVLVLAGALVSSFCLPYSLVTDESLDVNTWALMVAVSHSLCIPLLAVESFYFMAARFQASYNWMLVSGLVFFIGLGMALPGFILEFVDYLLGISNLTTNAYALLSLIVPVLFMIVTAIVAWRVMRPNRYLITSEGRKVRSK